MPQGDNREMDVVINGYEISRVECSRMWAVMKVGVTHGGWMFRTRRGAIKWASSQVAP